MCRRQRFSTHTRGSPVAVANVRLNISPSNASSSSGVTSGGGDLMSPMRPRSDGVAARTPCWSRACANRPARRSASRLAQRKRERGRQTTAILITIRQPSGARVRCSASAEGATSSSADRWSHPAGVRRPGFRRSGPSTAAPPERRAAPLREGRPCKVLPPLHSLDRLPRNLRRALSSRRRCERKAAPPQPGHQPCPASDAQLLRPSVGQGLAQYGVGARGGD